MKFIKVIVQNFLSYGPEVVIPLDIKDITLITGEVIGQDKYDSSGSGKSSILSAITYALFGETVYGLKADDVINNQVNKDCKVHLVLEDEGNTIEIKRFRKLSTGTKPDDLLVSVNGKDVSGSTAVLTQQKINKLIGIDLDIFKALMPGCGIEVASLTDSEIKKLLESILKTTELSAAYKIASDRFNNLDKEFSSKKPQLDSLFKSLDNSTRLKEQYKVNKEQFDDNKQKEIQSITEELEVILSEIASLESIDLNSINKVIESQESHSEHLNKQLTKYNTEESKQRAKLHKAELIFTRESSSINSKIKEIKESITRIVNLEESICPTCQSSVEREHVIDTTNQYRTSLSLLSNKLDKLKESNRKIVDGIQEKLNTALDNKAQTQHLLSLHTEHLNNNIQKYNQLKTQKEVLPSKIRTREFLETKFKEIQDKSNIFKELYEQEEANSLILNNQIQELQSEIDSITEDLLILEYWVKSFSPSGIRSYMIETVIPFLNEQAKYYSDILTSGEMSIIFSTKSSQKSGKIVEKFSIEVSQKNGSKKFKGSSKGEKARANLVISLSLGALASLRSSKKLGFRLFDEVFDCIDGVGCKAVYALLTQCLDQYETIYVITHKEDFKEIFNNNITIVKEHGFSSVEITQ